MDDKYAPQVFGNVIVQPSAAELANLPDELLEEIFLHINYENQLELRRTRRRWCRLLHNPSVLQTVTFSSLTAKERRSPNGDELENLADIVRKNRRNNQTIIFAGNPDRSSHSATTISQATNQQSKCHFFLRLLRQKPFRELDHTADHKFSPKIVFSNVTICIDIASNYEYSLSSRGSSMTFRNCTFHFSVYWLFGLEHHQFFPDSHMQRAIEQEYSCFYGGDLVPQLAPMANADWPVLRERAKNVAPEITAHVQSIAAMERDVALLLSNYRNLAMEVLRNLCQRWQSESSQNLRMPNSVDLMDYYSQCQPVVVRIFGLWLSEFMKYSTSCSS